MVASVLCDFFFKFGGFFMSEYKSSNDCYVRMPDKTRIQIACMDSMFTSGIFTRCRTLQASSASYNIKAVTSSFAYSHPLITVRVCCLLLWNKCYG